METTVMILFIFLASAVGTVTGFGTATIMVPVLGLYYPLGVTLLFTGVIHWFGNLWKMWFFRSGLQSKLILLFGVPGILASYLGAQVVPAVSEAALSRLLGFFLLLYVGFLSVSNGWKITPTRSSAITGGLLSGLASGVFGVGGAIRAAFLSAFRLRKDVFIFTAGAIGIFIDSGRIMRYLLDGFRLSNELLITLVLAIPVSYLGGYAGKLLAGKIPQESFRKVIAGALLLIAVSYVVWP